jgi:prolyl 4-hydroxylase
LSSGITGTGIGDVGDAVGELVVGAGVGAAEVGTDVGAAVVGTDVGAAVVGTDVGAAEVGTDVGSAVVGTDVGAAVVGSAVGRIVGRIVGAAVVGSAVGRIVGRIVGATVVGGRVGRIVGATVVGGRVGRIVGAAVVGGLVGASVVDGIPFWIWADARPGSPSESRIGDTQAVFRTSRREIPPAFCCAARSRSSASRRARTRRSSASNSLRVESESAIAAPGWWPHPNAAAVAYHIAFPPRFRDSPSARIRRRRRLKCPRGALRARGRGAVPELNDDWKIWIWQQIGRGCHKDHVFKALHERGFAWDAIRRELGHEPDRPLDEIEVPMVDATAVVGSGDPGAVRRVEVTPYLWELPGVLTPAECEVLIEAARDRLSPSTVVQDSERRGEEAEGRAEGRTSSTVSFDAHQAPTPEAGAVFAYLRRVVSDLTRLPEDHQEVIQITHYAAGQKFDAHRDDFAAGSEYLRFEAERGGQRVFSFMIYLNDVEEGGETEFPALGLACPAQQGKGIFWANVAEDGRPFPSSLHASRPVVRGEKWVLVCWIREAPFGRPVPGGSVSDWRGLDAFVPPSPDRAPPPWVVEQTVEQPKRIPFLNAGDDTCRGFERRRLDPSLFEEIRATFRSVTSELLMEEGDAIGTFVDTVRPELPAALHREVPELNRLLHQLLQPMHEEWCRFPLTPSACYGFRVYLSGAYLQNHVDRPATHVISSTLCVDHDLYAPWPLHVTDADGRHHELTLEPGELMLYESARIVHGRPVPLNGRYSAGLFIHYQPAEDHALWVESPRDWLEKHRP